MEYGHLHHVILEQRAGESYITFLYAMGLRESCMAQRSAGKDAPPLMRFATPVAATPQIALAFNQGDAPFIRANTAARDVRWSLFEFMKAHEQEDVRWHTIADDLRRNAALPLCAA